MFGNFQRRVQDWFGRLKINAGTTKAPALEIAQTWNDAGYAGTAIKANVTDTASASGSLLMDLQVGGTSKFKVAKTGVVSSLAGVVGGNGMQYEIRRADGFLWGGIGVETYTVRFYNTGGHSVIKFSYTDLYPAFQTGCGFFTDDGGVVDLFLWRDAANTLAQRNGTNAQESRLYGSYTSATAYQRLSTKTLREAVTCAAGASVTTTIIIPKFAHLIGVTTRVTTELAGSLTGYTVGDGTDPDLWGAITDKIVGTDTDAEDYTNIAALGPAATDRTITLTATDANFAGGVIEVCAYYLRAEAA